MLLFFKHWCSGKESVYLDFFCVIISSPKGPEHDDTFNTHVLPVKLVEAIIAFQNRVKLW